MFAFVEIKEKENLVKGQLYNVEFNSKNTINSRVYYRYSRTFNGLKKEKYSIERSFKGDAATFEAPESGFYEFFLSYDIVLPESKVFNFSLE